MHRHKDLRPALPILIGAAVMLTLSMGVRQSFGLIMQPLTRDIAITVADFTLAIAVQNSPGASCSRSPARSRCASVSAPSCSRAPCSISPD